LRIEVCHADARGAVRVAVDLAEGAVLDDALAARDIVARLGLARARVAFAVFGRRADGSTVLRGGDRVEVLDPLIVEPKEARRRRVEVRRAPSSTTRRRDR